jgi:hypothetical protein
MVGRTCRCKTKEGGDRIGGKAIVAENPASTMLIFLYLPQFLFDSSFSRRSVTHQLSIDLDYFIGPIIKGLNPPGA